jgi:hypothetical protein
MTTLRKAVRRMSVRVVVEQAGLALVVFLLGALWLHMPDASALDVIGSSLLGLIVVAVAGGGETAIVLRLTGRERTRGLLLRGALWMLLGAALWLAWGALLARAHGSYNQNDVQWAGYLNSRVPHALRNIFSYAHILLWIQWLGMAVAWAGTGAIAIPVFAMMASQRPLRAMLRALRSVTYWITVVVVTIEANICTGALMGWTPGHGLRVETLSLLLRLGAAAILDALVACLLLAILAECAECVVRSDAAQATRVSSL